MKTKSKAGGGVNSNKVVKKPLRTGGPNRAQSPCATWGRTLGLVGQSESQIVLTCVIKNEGKRSVGVRHGC